MGLLQLAVDGLALGAIYALTALGFVLILNGIGAVNFAHGDLVTTGGFLAIAFAVWLPDWPGIVLLPFIAILVAFGGLALSMVAQAPVAQGYLERVHLGTFAVGGIIAALLSAGFGAAPRAGPPLLSTGHLQVLDMTISRQSLAVIAVAVVLVPAVHLLLGSTQFGRRLRAAAQDPDLARALGIDTKRMIGATFMLGTALAAAAGVLLADRFAIAPGHGVDLAVKAYIAVAIAGWGRVGGAALVAILIALFETLFSHLAPTALADTLIYFFLLVMLVLRPEGWFGAAVQRRD
jgi:branched-chain amino acid transport system permease protein